jgi:hypothetical protein
LASWGLALILGQFLVESLLDDLQLEALHDPLLKNLKRRLPDSVSLRRYRIGRLPYLTRIPTPLSSVAS